MTKVDYQQSPLSSRISPKAEPLKLVKNNNKQSSQLEKEELHTSKPISRSSSNGIKYSFDPKSVLKGQIKDKQYQQKLLEMELDKVKNVTRPEKQMTIAEKEQARFLAEKKKYREEQNVATFHPDIDIAGHVKSCYEDQTQKLNQADEIAKRLVLRRSSNPGCSDEVLIKKIKQEIANGVEYPAIHGYDYNILRTSGLLDPKASQLLQKTGYAAVSEIYKQAEEFSSGVKLNKSHTAK